MTKTSTTKPKARKVTVGFFTDLFADTIALGITHLFMDHAGKLTGVVKSVVSSFGSRDDELTPEKVSQFIGGIRTKLDAESMSKAQKREYENIMQETADDIHIAALMSDDAARAVRIAEIKRNTRQKLTALADRYREASFDERILSQLSESDQKLHDDMAMTPEQESEYIKLRGNVKSVEVFGRILREAADADDFLRRLRRCVATPPKPDPQQVLSAKIAEGGKVLKQGLEAVDGFIKGILPYEEIRLPNMKLKELWADYWDRVIASADVQSQKQSGEDDATMKKRLMADKKFVAIVERKLKERNQRLRTA